MKSAGSNVWPAVENAFTLAALLLLSGVRLERNPADAVEGSMLTQVAFLGIYGAVFSLLVLRWRQTIAVIPRNRALWVLVLYAMSSIVWSLEPGATLRRLTSFVGASLVGVYLGSRLRPLDLLNLLGGMLFVAMGLSFVVAVGAPSFGRQPDGLWQGIYGQKNLLARLAVLAILIMVLLSKLRARPRLVLRLSFALAVLLLAMTRSKTSLIAAIVLTGLLLIYCSCRSRPLLQVVAIACLLSGPVVLAGTWLAFHFEDVAIFFGKDPTLTGRTSLWSAVIEMIAERPWLGYGFGGFWLGREGDSAYVCRMTGWEPPHAHNGYLDVWLDLGAIGLALYGIGFTLAFFRTASDYRRTGAAESLWGLSYLSFLLLFNLTESTTVRANSLFFWAIYVSVLLSRPARCGISTKTSELVIPLISKPWK